MRFKKVLLNAFVVLLCISVLISCTKGSDDQDITTTVCYQSYENKENAIHPYEETVVLESIGKKVLNKQISSNTVPDPALTIDLLDHYDLDLVEKMNERDGMTITFKALPDKKY